MKPIYYFLLTAVLAVLEGCGTAQVRTTRGGNANWIDQQHRDFAAVAESSVTENGVQVYLKGDSLFKLGRSKLTTDGSQKVDSLAALLLKYPKDQVTVMVYTDNSGNPARNLKLTQRRANAIKAELAKQGVPEASLTAVGEGEQNPVAPNDTAEDRAQNRRVELDIASM